MTPGFVPTAGPTTLTREQARTLVDEVKADAMSLAEKLLRLYEDGAHHALGYKSWSAFATAEFEELRSKSYAYRMLTAARVDRALAELPIGDRPKSESVARELVPALKDGPEAVVEAWDRAVQEHGSSPTAAQVRETVKGASGDAVNAREGAQTTRCPACGSTLAQPAAGSIPADPATVRDVAPSSPGDYNGTAAPWFNDPGPEPGRPPMLELVDESEYEADLAA